MTTTADRREYRRQYYLAHREQEIERQRKYYEAHREQQNECSRQYYAEHRDEMLECQRKWREENPERLRGYSRKYRESHREQIREARRKWNDEHRDQIRETRRRYRKKMKLAKKLGLVSVKGKFITPEQVKSTVTEATAPKKKHHAAVYARSDRATRHEQLMARRGAFWDFVGETLAEYDHQKSVQQYERTLEHSRKYHAKHREKDNEYKRQQYAKKRQLRSAVDD